MQQEINNLVSSDSNVNNLYKVIIPYTESANPKKKFKVEYTIEATSREAAFTKAEREFYAYTRYNSASWIRIMDKDGVRIWKLLPDFPNTINSIDELAKKLQSSDEDIIYNALKLVEKLEDASLARYVVPLLRHTNIDIQLLAVEALGKMGDKNNLMHLLRLYNPNLHPTLKATIVSALAKLATIDDPIQEIILSALADDDPRVRANAVEAVERLNLPSLAKMLLPLLEDEDNRVKANVLRALWNIHDKATLNIKLLEMINHPNHWMRASAAFVLRHIKAENHFDLIKKLLDDKSLEVHNNAWKALLAVDSIDSLKLCFEYMIPHHVSEIPDIIAKVKSIKSHTFDEIYDFLLSIKPYSRQVYNEVCELLNYFEGLIWQNYGIIKWLEVKYKRLTSNYGQILILCYFMLFYNTSI